MFSISQMSAILMALPDPAFILTRSGRYAAIFGGADSRYYHDGSGLVGKTLDDVLAEDKARWFAREIRQALDTRRLHVVEYCLAGSDVKGLLDQGPQSTIRFEGRIQALDFPVLEEDAVLWVASNITARSELEAKLRLQSETDALTGLCNRRKLRDALMEHFSVFTRYHTPTALLIFDIDNFKRVNDEFGHPRGDDAIVIAANVCRSELRNTDIAARLGGDEFVVLMPHTSLEQARMIAERLRMCVALALREAGTIGSGTTISGGLSELLSTDTSFEDVVKRADDALYRAKRSGRNQIVKDEVV